MYHEELAPLPNRSAISKRVKYGWTMEDSPGVFMLINKHDLQVDEQYQRTETASEPKIKSIASEWSWLACGCLIVGLRDDEFRVIDGMHRLMAARKRDDISDLPCLVFEVDDARAEALGFLRVNTNRKPMTMREKWKGLSFVGDNVARTAAELAAQSGRKIAKHSDSTTISCVSAVMRCVAEDEAATRRIWPLVVEVCRDQPLHGQLLAALHYIERNAIDASIVAQPWRGRVLKVGYMAMLSAMTKARAFHAKGGPKVDAEGVVNLLNIRARTQPLVLRHA
jgi:hypothetical protein